MVALVVFLSVYVAVTVGFFVALVRWTIRSERGCACAGTMQARAFGVIHGPTMCYPAAEALRPGW